MMEAEAVAVKQAFCIGCCMWHYKRKVKLGGVQSLLSGWIQI